MTQQELDDLFRANSERGEFAPEPGEWGAMTTLLEEDERKERYARRVSIGWMTLFTLLIFGGVYGLWQSVRTSNIQPESAAEVERPIADFQPLKSPASPYTEHDSQTEANATVGAATNTFQSSNSPSKKWPEQTAARSSEKSNSHLNKNAQSPLSFENSNPKTTDSGFETPEEFKTNKSSVISPVVLEKSDVQAHLVEDEQLVPEIKNQVLVATPSALNASIKAIENQEPSSPDALLSNELVSLELSTPSLSATPPITSADLSAMSQFGLGFFVGQELNSVAMSNKLRFGTRVGAQLRYKPSSRWSIDLGASYTHKSYMAPKGEMKNTMGLFFDDILPSQTDGTADILEIPLTVTFLLNGHGKSGPFLSGGLISYRIFREELAFQYDQPTNQVSGTSAPDKSAVFGTTHLQAGYQFVPRKGPAYRVGPYVHVPISMVGSGELPIYSVGLQLGIELF